MPAQPKVFVCGRCELRCPYEYFGQKPDICPHLIFLEPVYTLRDPFAAFSRESTRRAIVVGAKCSMCDRDGECMPSLHQH